MKAVYIAEPGGPEKLLYGDRPDPEPGPGDVIVRVRATALNHADLYALLDLTLVVAVAVCVLNLVADILYAAIDPRVRFT